MQTKALSMKAVSFLALLAAASLFLYPLTSSAATSQLWLQDFEVDTDGWFDSNNGGYGILTQGGGTAIAEGDGSSAPFSRFDGYRDVWPGEWLAEVDVYLDPSWTAGQGFDYSVAASGSDGNHQRDYIFHVTKDTSDDALYVSGSNNTNFAPREDLENQNHFEVTEAGWYTLQHRFYDDGGSLSVDLNLLDDGGAVLFTETRSNVADTIPAEVGGNRYSWFTFINVDGGVEIDNHELLLPLPDPEVMNECKKDGFEAFGFKNQGQCVRFVETGKDSRE